MLELLLILILTAKINCYQTMSYTTATNDNENGAYVALGDGNFFLHSNVGPAYWFTRVRIISSVGAELRQTDIKCSAANTVTYTENIISSKDGGIICSGRKSLNCIAGDERGYVYKLDSNLNIGWSYWFPDLNSAFGLNYAGTEYLILGVKNADSSASLIIVFNEQGTISKSLAIKQDTILNAYSAIKTDSALYATGVSWLSNVYGCFINIYDYNTDQSIYKRFIAGTDLRCYDIVLDTSKNAYMVGFGTFSINNGDAYVIKTDAAGTQIWAKQFDFSSSDYFSSIIKVSDNYFIASGYSFTGTGTSNWLVMFDSNNNLINEYKYEEPGYTNSRISVIIPVAPNLYAYSGMLFKNDIWYPHLKVLYFYIKCNAGFYPTSDSCQPCEAGTYQNQANQASCIDCSIGTYAKDPGAIICSQCPTGNKCPNTKTVTPTPCPEGEFQSSTGKTSCSLCDVGFFNSETGATACTQCPEGSFSDTQGAKLCTPCDVGHYQTAKGQTSCTKCLGGTYQDETGKTVCKDCLAGTYSTDGSSSCTKCLPGEYQNLTKQPSCSKCDAGLFSANYGTTSCSQCSEGSFSDTPGAKACTLCSVGYYQASKGQASCNKCNAGTYQDETGKTTCKFNSGNLLTFFMKCVCKDHIHQKVAQFAQNACQENIKISQNLQVVNPA